MNNAPLKAIGLVSGGLLATSLGCAAQSEPVNADISQDTGVQPIVEALQDDSSAVVSVPHIQGSFSFDQNVTTDNAQLAKMLYKAPSFLCGSKTNEFAKTEPGSNAAPHSIEVTGDVNNPMVASIQTYTEKHPVKKIMSCTCIGNPADGASSSNAQVEGFTLSSLIKDADPAADANTITFVSKDGYSVSFPLAYVSQRYAIIVTALNEESAEAAVGCENQLWLGSTSARYFAQDIVEIQITHEDNIPAVPKAPQAANQPNVGVMQGS